MTSDQQKGETHRDTAEKPNNTAKCTVTLQQVSFSDGTTIDLDQSDIVVFVGPNNAGKSAALRDLQKLVGNQGHGGCVVVSATLRRTGTIDDFANLINGNTLIRRDEVKSFERQGYRFHINVGGPASFEAYLPQLWGENSRVLTDLFCYRLPTETRITDSNSIEAIVIPRQPPHSPIHLLYSDDGSEAKLSAYFRRAFNFDLILDRLGGARWPLLVGNRQVPAEGEDRLSLSYTTRLRSNSAPLEEQGDGMRSFASVILHFLTPNNASILILDEPEACLHPSQARLLGEFIATERRSNTQLFVATHSPDVLQGILGSTLNHVRVVRLERLGDINRAKELDKYRAKEINNDPLLRYSNVFSGLFHERVIICEADSDCTFYSSILNIPAVRGAQQPDVLFVHAGGKHRMASLAELLCSLGIRVDVIADIDVLNELAPLERLVSSLGGQWADFDLDARPLKLAIEQHKPWLAAPEIAKGIREILVSTPGSGEFPRELRSKIQTLFTKASPWDAVKSAGKSAIPAGDASKHFSSLQKKASSIGLWIVPVGELEGFCKSEGGHGPSWVQKVLERNIVDDPDFAEARKFVTELWNRQLS